MGGFISGLVKHNKSKGKYAVESESYSKLLKQEKEKIFDSYIGYFKAAVQKLKDGAELTAEERNFLHKLNFDPMQKYLSKDELDKILDEFINCNDIAGGFSPDKNLQLTFDSPISNLASKFHFMIRDKYLEQLGEKADNSDFIKLLGDDYNNFINWALERCKTKDGEEGARCIRQFPQLFWAEYVGTKGEEYAKTRGLTGDEAKNFVDEYEIALKHLTPHEHFKNSYSNFSKDKINSAQETIKSQLNKKLTKETLKTAGIGAAIAGGVALIGSLIYKSVKNKNAGQDK